MQDSRDDVHWMRLALVEASKGLGAVEPNPMVGAVVVRDGGLVGVGHHERFGGPHAEVMALHQAGEAARGATLYVTLEPCCHFGKTPPCTAAILDAGIVRVVAAVRDPFPAVNGGGIAVLEEAGVAIEVGCEAEAGTLPQPALLETADHRLALCHRQVGDDPRRQDGGGLRRQPLDLLGDITPHGP